MLHDWTNFFEITGAPGAQLIGLLFVVVAGSSVLLLAAGIFGAWDLTLWIIENRGET